MNFNGINYNSYQNAGRLPPLSNNGMKIINSNTNLNFSNNNQNAISPAGNNLIENEIIKRNFTPYTNNANNYNRTSTLNSRGSNPNFEKVKWNLINL
jgi:hypothetical protein